MKDVNILKNAGIDVDKSLELFGDMQSYDQMLEDFLKEVDGKLANARKFKEEANMADYAIVVHSLKSDCKYFGLMSLADMFYEHELAGKRNDYIFVSTNYDTLEVEARKYISILKKYMGVIDDKIENINNMLSSSDLQTILVVDDSNVIRNFVSKIFNGKYDVKIASDGDEAISIVANSPSNKIACMLLDLNMPNVNGFAVLDYFKSNNLFSRIPVSIITGSNDRNIIGNAFNYPIVDMLQKPFNEISVKNVVEKTISRRVQ